MTAGFDALCEEPQTSLDIADLAPDERLAVRRIHIAGTTGATPSVSVGRFTGVWYLAGDEKQAATRFVAENRAALSQLDFSRRNPISTSVDRDIYDWILHALGERELERYETVVVERRPDGTIWCLGRRTFEETPLRRYTTGGQGSAKIEGMTLGEVYDSLDRCITESALTGHPAVSGDVREVLDVFRQSPAFACKATAIDDELAIEKVDTEKTR